MVVAARIVLLMIQLIALISLTISCSKKRPEQREITSQLGDLLKDAKSALDASMAIRSADFNSCDDMLAVLRSLDALRYEKRFSVQSTIGLIKETVDASRPSCGKKDQKNALGKPLQGQSEGIAFSLIVADPQVALDQLKSSKESALILRRRAQLHFDLKEHKAGRDALLASLRYEDDEDTRVRVARLLNFAGDAKAALELCEGRDGDAFRLPRAGALAAMGLNSRVIAQIDAAPLHLRQEIAEEAARLAADPMKLASESLAGAELLVALRNRMGPGLEDRGAALLQRAAQLQPEEGDLWTALATTLEGIARPMDALQAWDEAAKRNIGAEKPILAPIRILREEGHAAKALARAAQLADKAEAAANSKRPEALRLAGLAYRYAGDSKKAVHFARDAVKSRPGDGRLTFELASRLEEDSQREAAAEVLSTLLVCGARGQAWHRHEVAAQLTLLVGVKAVPSYIHKSEASCEVVDAEDLYQHVEASL